MEPDKPKYFHARAVPYVLKEEIEKELDRLVKNGVYQQVLHSKSAAPIDPVIEHGSVRIWDFWRLQIDR